MTINIRCPWGLILPLSGWVDATRISFGGVLAFVAATCHGLSSRYLFQPAPRFFFFCFYGGFVLRMIGLIFSGDLLSLFLF